MDNGISVIICCYNSASNLPRTLQALALQQTDSDIHWEVIVVDNNSTDNTKTVATQEWKKFKTATRIHVVDEKKTGLSFARAKGFDIAQFEFCLFCDDDNWLQSDYINKAYRLLQGDHRIGVLGGLGEAECEVSPPAWFNELKGGYAVGKQADRTGDVSNRGYVYGAAALFRKSVYLTLKQIGFESLLSDRKGALLSSGGDKELCYAYRLRNYKIFYSEELKFKHFIPQFKLTKSYATRMFMGFSSAQPILNLYEYVIKDVHEGKSNLNLMWLKDLLYTLFLIVRFAGRGKLNFQMQVAVLRELLSLRTVYQSLYEKIASLKARGQ